MRHLEELNLVQREAVEATDGPVLILAGAGSGKTRVLTHKVAHLIQNKNIAPEHILAFTFTNRAAEEMRERIGRLLSGQPAGLWAGTFHATCVRMLRRYAGAAGIDRDFSIFDRDDSLRVVKRAIKSRHLTEQEFRPRSILERISTAKSSRTPASAMRDAAASRHAELVADIYAEYEKALGDFGALDFDDLLLRALRLLEDSPDVRDRLADRFRYVLVDEYQDTNLVQFEITRLLASKHRNLTVVGDDDQSIYGWRGADIRNILDFEKHFPEAKVLRLVQNYRSTKRILAAANAVVSFNNGRKPKELWTENDEGEKLTLMIAPDEEREAEDVVRRMLTAKAEDGARWWQFAVLYRTNAQSRPFEEVCIRHGVPYRLVGSVHFFQRKEVKNVLAYLRLAANPRDAVSFERAVQVPRRGIGKVSLARFVDAGATYGGDLVRAACEARSIDTLSLSAAESLATFGALIRSVQAMEEQPVEETIEHVIRESGIWAGLIDGGPEAQSTRENLDELVSGARYFSIRSETPGFKPYLGEVSLRTDIDAWDPGEEAVTLMTTHNAKGLEFDEVFVSGLVEGLFPHASSLDDVAELEEERRLFYVALTRAQRRCHLSGSLDRRRLNRLEMATRLSRFVDEIPDKLLDKRDPWGLGLQSGRFFKRPLVRKTGLPEDAGPDAGLDWEEPTIDVDADRGATYLGRVVRHPKFGRGVVLAQDGAGDNAKCSVRFAGQVTRKIVARYLDLEG